MAKALAHGVANYYGVRDIVLEEASPIASTWIGAERALHALLSGKEPITDRLLLEPLAVVPGANGYARYARFIDEMAR